MNANIHIFSTGRYDDPKKKWGFVIWVRGSKITQQGLGSQMEAQVKAIIALKQAWSVEEAA